MTCAAFEHWLDEGLPQSGAAGARAHAADCAGCAALLAAAQAIESGLARAAFTAPARLTDTVMARVAAIEARHAAPVSWPPARDAFPWWVRAARDPAVVAATLLSGLLVWQWDAIAGAGVAVAAWLARTGTGLTPAAPAWTPSLGVQIVAAMLLVPVSLWLARAAFHASERWVERAAGRRA